MLATIDSIKAQMKSSLTHKFIEASINIVEEATMTDKINLKSNSKIEATSPLGLNIAMEHTGVAGIKTEEISAESTFNGMVKVGPMYGKTTSTQSFAIYPFRPEAKIDSTVELDSSLLQFKNIISASLTNGEFSVVSNTNAFEDTLTHGAVISLKDSKLSLKSDANAFALGMKIRNQAEASVGAGEVIMRIETNTDHSENRVYSLLTAILDVNGLVVNSDATMKLLENEGTHKATLKMSKDGLITSGTTTLLSLLSLENTFNAGFDGSKATLSITNKAAMQDMKVDNANTLTITLSSLDFSSKTEAAASSDASYDHDITISLKPYTATAKVNNNLNLLMGSIINEARLQVEMYKMDLTGSLKAAYGDDEIKNTYQVNYADMTANAKTSTIGKLFGTQMSHNTEVEVAGFAARITNDGRFNSQPMRFDHTIRCSIVPFDFNLDAIFNADGDMVMYGKHSAQLYGKFLLKAQPLAFASSHECRASLSQQLDNGVTLETTFDNRMDNVLSPQEQKTSFRLKSKVNEHAFNQDFNAYNTAERTGIEVSGTILTNILNTESTENQEFTISGFVKYDKNTDCHLIQLPLMEHLPAIVEIMRDMILRVAETLQNYISNEEIRATFEAFPRHVSDFISKLNVEGNLIQLQQYFSDVSAFAQKHVISMEDVEGFIRNLQVTVEKLLADLSVYIQNVAVIIREILISGALPDTLIQKLNAINKEYEIQATIVHVITTMTDMIREVDLQKLEGSSIAFLRDIDAQFKIKNKLNSVMSFFKRAIEVFDINDFVAELKRFLASFNLKSRIERLVSRIPTKHLRDMTDYITKVIRDYDVIGKINAVFAKIRDFIAKTEADQKVQAMLENAVELIKQFRIQETIRTLSEMVMEVDLPAKIMQVFQNAIKYLKTTEIKEQIKDLNGFLDNIVRELKSFTYNDIVDYANRHIARYTSDVNDMIRSLEIPQKLEATRDFVNLVLSSGRSFMERLKEIKVAEIIKSLKDIVDRAVFDSIQSFAEYVKEEITKYDVETEISSFLGILSETYTIAIRTISEMLDLMTHVIEELVFRSELMREIRQIIHGISSGLCKAEVNVPSFTVPFTDLVVPSWMFSMNKLGQIDIPTQLDIPEFTILGMHTVRATTISFDDIKLKITQLIDFFLNFEIKMLDMDAFFGDLTLNFIPLLPEVAIPEIPLPEISFPTIPKVPVEKLVKSLQVPEFKLPSIPSEIMVPCFGKLYGEIRLHTPIYAVKTSAEVQNATGSEMTPTFTGIFTSEGTSQTFKNLNYKLDSTARIALPKMSRVVFAETVKLTHQVFGVDHHASLILYGLSAQAQAKTDLKIVTSPYTANFMNMASIGMEKGMSAILDTTYSHSVNLPIMDFTSEAAITQKAVLRQDDYTLTLTVDNSGKGKFNGNDGNHKSNLHMSLAPRIVTLTFSGDTDSTMLKMKQQVSAEFGTLTYFKFNIRNEAEGSVIKNSLFVASGQASLSDMKLGLKANHDTELYGEVSGIMSNGINIFVQPFEFFFEFQNKGNARANILETLTAKIDLQNDYSVIFKPDSQQINTVALVRLNQYNMFYNFTINNNKNEAGIFVAMESKANLDFLTSPISIPELDLPFVDFRTPAISDLNLYEQTGLKNILTTTDQTVNMDAKVVYQKSQASPLVDMMGMIQIPCVGNLITELSFKSAILNLNVNAGMYAEDDLVIRLRANTASVFESLKAKLDGTTSLTTKRGIKLANSLSLENRHIDGTHDSTISMSPETFDTAVSVTTAVKIALPILTLEANQNLLADTKNKANALSTMSMKGDFNIPVIRAVGKTNADYSLKLEGTFDYVSTEFSTRASMDGTILEDYLILGVLDNEVNLYLNNDGFRSTSKVIADGKLNHGTNKVLSMDVNENLAVEASLTRVYAVLKYTGNNEANLFNFNTNGKHVVQATVDFVPTSPFTVDIEMDISQPSSLGDFTVFVKNVADVTAFKQKMSTNVKFISPLYTTNLVAEAEGNAPVFKVTIKSSATSVIKFLDYDMDGELININRVYLL